MQPPATITRPSGSSPTAALRRAVAIGGRVVQLEVAGSHASTVGTAMLAASALTMSAFIAGWFWFCTSHKHQPWVSKKINKKTAL